MPEAVIVATARSPIGRAGKGSLVDLRPDDLAATIIRTALDTVPELDPREIDDLYLGCGLPGGEQGGAPTWHDPRADGEVPDIYLAMGQTAENLAQVYGVTREDMDEFGVRSQNLAEKAIADGFWQREITPVTTPDGRVVGADDG